jgi:hypothetical protein
MTIQNYGKTPGFITKVEYGFCPRNEWPCGKSVSQALSHHEFRGKYLEPYPKFAKEPIQPNTEWLPFRHVEFRRDEKLGQIFFGRIEYVDIFRVDHYSTFKLLIDDRFTEPMDNAYAYDWD